MNKRFFGLLAVLCLAFAHAAVAAGPASITLKKPEGGALELSNLSDEDDAEVLVEGKESSPGDTAAGSDDTAKPARSRDRALAERGDMPARNDAATRDDERRAGGERDRPADAAPAIGHAVANGGPYAPAAAGSAGTSGPNTPPLVSVDPDVNAVAPNPRPATDNAVPYVASTSDTSSQERYAAKMVQEAAAATAARTMNAMDNPAAVRRYLMVDRVGYQSRIGR